MHLYATDIHGWIRARMLIWDQHNTLSLFKTKFIMTLALEITVYVFLNLIRQFRLIKVGLETRSSPAHFPSKLLSKMDLVKIPCLISCFCRWVEKTRSRAMTASILVIREWKTWALVLPMGDSETNSMNLASHQQLLHSFSSQQNAILFVLFSKKVTKVG